MLRRWKTGAKALKREVTALTIALRDPRVPWYARGWLGWWWPTPSARLT